MTALEIVLTAALPLLMAAGAGILKIVQWNQQRRERVEMRRIEAEERDGEREDRTVERLWACLKEDRQRIQELEDTSHECLKQLAEAKVEIERSMRESVRAETKREVKRALSDPRGIPVQREVQKRTNLPSEHPFPPRKKP
jgi:uncharacterized protein HemX